CRRSRNSTGDKAFRNWRASRLGRGRSRRLGCGPEHPHPCRTTEILPPRQWPRFVRRRNPPKAKDLLAVRRRRARGIRGHGATVRERLLYDGRRGEGEGCWDLRRARCLNRKSAGELGDRTAWCSTRFVRVRRLRGKWEARV